MSKWKQRLKSIIPREKHAVSPDRNADPNSQVPDRNPLQPGASAAASQPKRHSSRWQQASDQLKLDKPNLHRKLSELLYNAGTSPSDGTVLQESLNGAISANIEKVADRQWRIKWGTRNVAIRDLLGRTMKAFQIVKELGTSFASLDPIHAGLPWAGICMLLTILSSFPSQEEAAQSGVEKMAELVARYTVIESLYVDIEEGDLSRSYNKALVGLYAKILEYQIIAACHFGRYTIARIGSSVVKSSSFQDLLKEVNEQENTCQAIIQVLELAYQRQREKYIEKYQKLLRKSQSKNDVFTWLSTIQYGSDHDFVRRKLGSRYHQSGEWLIQSEAYQRWEAIQPSTPAVFWFRGHVGTGKSSLTSIVVQRHLENLGQSSDERVAYFYCSGKTQKPPEPLEMFRCLLSQLAWSSDGQTIAQPILDVFKRADTHSGGGKPDIDQCVDLIGTIQKNTPKVTIIIDALDECSDWRMVIASLTKLIKDTNQIRLFLTSRMQVEVDEMIKDYVVLGPESNVQDVQNFIRTQVTHGERRLLKGRNPELETRLIEVLSERSENMFRWVELQLETFLSTKSRLIHPEDVKLRLDHLASEIGMGHPSLDEVYDEIYEINTPWPHTRYLADKILKWLCLPTLPRRNMMLVSNILEIVATKPDGTKDQTIDVAFILNICSNLVITKSDADRKAHFQFAHLSVLDFLRKKLATDNQGSEAVWPRSVQEQVATDSLQFMGLGMHHEKRIMTRNGILMLSPRAEVYSYARRFWPIHFRASDTSQVVGHTADMFNQLIDGSLHDNMAFDQWFHILRYSKPPFNRVQFPMEGDVSTEQGKPSKLFCAILIHAEEVVRHLPRGDFAELNRNGANVFEFAIKFGSRQIIEYLLVEGLVFVGAAGTLKVGAEQIEYGSALHLISSFHRYDLVGLLLAHDATVDKKDVQGHTPLHIAVNEDTNGSHDATVAALLANGADPNIKDVSGRTALHIYCSNLDGDDKTVTMLQALLGGGADPRIRDNAGQSPISTVRSSRNSLSKIREVGRARILWKVYNRANCLIKAGADTDGDDLAWIDDMLRELQPRMKELL